MRLLSVRVRDESVVYPTYLPAAPDHHPMFLENRVYQGSSGRVYPLPVIDRIAGRPVPRAWRSITLENDFVAVQILPEIGGRVHRLLDKTNGYDALYYQPVIKPALVALAGPWISGGIEFNWPQHHRPSTFMPAEVEIEREPGGAVTVWLSEHDPLCRMKGMHGVRLRPDSSALELRVRVYNRTPAVQTFLWWANVATEVHERYQSFFPADVTHVADHAKRATSTFPLCTGRYYGVDYAQRARDGVPAADQPRQFRPDGASAPNDLSWYANIPVPTSYMCMGTREPFFGGYDHRAHAGLVHVADPHLAPGKKQWTWGNHEFGYAWDRHLTDADSRGVHRPYIELMAGVYTDNQPDFSYLQPGETKTWTQRWYPIRDIGPADAANEILAASLRLADGRIHLGLHASRVLPGARITLQAGRRRLAGFRHDLSPAAPLTRAWRAPAGLRLTGLELRVTSPAGAPLLVHRPSPPAPPPTPAALQQLVATEPPAPAVIASADELYLTGLHLEQYRHATRRPEIYWHEALRRDPGDARCNLALGRWHLRRGEFADAETRLRASIARLTIRNPNPADGEAHYQLGRTLGFVGREADAYAAFAKATWNDAWVGPACHALAEIDCVRADWPAALDHLSRSLTHGTDNLRARALQVMVLRRLGRAAEAAPVLRESLRRDPLDAWSRHLAGRPWRGDNAVRLDVGFDLARAGFNAEAIALLRAADDRACDGSVPMLRYTIAWLHERLGQTAAARAARLSARRAAPAYCFPSRLEEIGVLRAALAAQPHDPRAALYLGHLLYDRRRHREAVTLWRQAVKGDPANAVAWRCLGLAAYNVLGQPAAARAAYARACRAAPHDPRLLYEADQLAKKLGDSPARRLRVLQRHLRLVRRRDDLVIELCALHNQTGRPDQALRLLASRRFQPWEGGEGTVLGQYSRARLLLARARLAAADHAGAIAHLQAALTPPENLGEARHLLANQSDLHFWLGEAFAAARRPDEARAAWTRAAEFSGDFQQMSVQAFSEMTWFSATARQRLGDSRGAIRQFRALLAYAKALEKSTAKVDYFAASLPAMLLFNDDIQARLTTTARFLQAQAHLGLGAHARAHALLDDVLDRDPNYSLAADFRALATRH